MSELVQVECRRWARKGVNINYEIRDNRRGYKAGALKEGMKHGYVKDCYLVAIFDADFQWCSIPFLVHNPDIALVQAREDLAEERDWGMVALAAERKRGGATAAEERERGDGGGGEGEG
uniref:Glycosyltransferase 2-like domain-containing protein n=1 Tax=Aegilops tauschii TaxID=37682 RepID=M8D284_AEGTA